MPLSNSQIKQLIQRGELTGIEEQDILPASILLHAGSVIFGDRHITFIDDKRVKPILIKPNNHVVVLTSQHITLSPKYIGIVHTLEYFTRFGISITGTPLINGYAGIVYLQLNSFDMAVELEQYGAVAQLVIDEVEGEIAYLDAPQPPTLKTVRSLVANLRLPGEDIPLSSY